MRGRAIDDSDLNSLIVGIGLLGPQSGWEQWGGGWPNQAELALLDAVFSMRARYAGVRRVVERWCRRHDAPSEVDDLAVLASCEPVALANLLDNRQRVPGRSQTKAAAVVSAAQNFTAIGVRHARQVTSNPNSGNAYTSVPGLGPITWTYMLMLLGVTDVKADRMIQRFVATALGRQCDADECRRLVVGAANQMQVEPSMLDHAIWSYQRRQRPRRP